MLRSLRDTPYGGAHRCPISGCGAVRRSLKCSQEETMDRHSHSTGGLRRIGAIAAIGALALGPGAAVAGAQGTGVGFICDGRLATIVGNEGNDTISGTAGPDVIVGLGGDDIIDGGAGDDLICAGAGNDNVSGGIGADTVSGEDGDDVIASSF